MNSDIKTSRHPLTDEELDSLTSELEAVIAEIGREYRVRPIGRRGQEDLLPESQQERLERETGEKAEDFIPRFKRIARRDLCEKGGFIHDQWERYRKISNRDLVSFSAGTLTAMGIASNGLLAATVPVALWISLALANIGLKAICED